MLCETFSLTLSSIASTIGDLLGFIFLTLLPIRNPHNKYKNRKISFSVVPANDDAEISEGMKKI